MSSTRVRFTRTAVVIQLSWTIAIKALICLAVTLGAALIPLPGLDEPGPRICLMIFAGAAALWITELIPAYATAIAVIVLSVYLLGMPDGPLGLDPAGVRSWQMFINPVASPVLVLFFGGFILARAASKHGFDLRLARLFITPFGNRPAWLLLGVILTTAVFSMFMSNTATTAMMLAIVSPLLAPAGGRDRFRKGLVLAVPFAANIGGMGTLIGSPPNAVAASVLQSLGPEYEITFLGWMLMGVPIVAVLLLMLWGVLVALLRPGREPLEIQLPQVFELTLPLIIVVATFAVTVLMWLSQPLHQIPPAVVALLPIGVFTVFGIIDREDLRRLDWDVLILVAGGMALGVAMHESGLSAILVALVPFDRLHPAIVLTCLILLTIALSNFMSNTSAANLLIPIVTSLSVAVLPPKLGALAVALAASLAMSLPISTPPNAIAFATRAVTTGDMVRFGTIVSATGVALLVAVFLVFGRWIA